MWTTKRLLIWGKTYPEFSKTYYETVCTGALDAESGKLVRIYPITLRYMKEQFSTYQWIEAEVQKNTSDFRPESFKIQQDTIRIGEKIGPKNGWEERRRLFLRAGNVFRSVEALQAAESRDHTSLGLVKPKQVKRIYVRKRSEAERQEWDDQRDLALKQRELFVDAETKTKDLTFMPVQYQMCFTCDDPSCSTEHDFSVLDWGVYALSRKQFAHGGGASLAERQVISKLEEITDPTKKDMYFFLGNTQRHCTNFMIVGFFYPPIVASEPPSTSAGSSLKLPGFD